MIQRALQLNALVPQPPVIDDLGDAQDQLARMAALLHDSYLELLARFDSIQLDEGNQGATTSVLEINQFVGHAAAALHYEGRASQLIGLSLNRMALARNALKNLAVRPNNHMTRQVWAAGITTCADLPPR